MAFDGNSRINIADTPSLAVRPESGATLSFWLKPTGAPADVVLFQRSGGDIVVGARGSELYARVTLAGDVDELLHTHYLVTGPRRDVSSLPDDQEVIAVSHTDRQTTILVRTDGRILDPACTVSELSLEDLVLAYMARPAADVRNGRAALEVLR